MFQTIRNFVDLFSADITPTQSQYVPQSLKISLFFIQHCYAGANYFDFVALQLLGWPA